MNTSSKNITLALQDLGFNVMSIKQMTAKWPSFEGPVTTTSLPLTLTCCQKSQIIFTFPFPEFREDFV
jgi:hypothetical protein